MLEIEQKFAYQYSSGRSLNFQFCILLGMHGMIYLLKLGIVTLLQD